MRRRAFITLLGGAAAVWPLMGRAQQRTLPVVGILSVLTRETLRAELDAFGHGLSEFGYVAGQNVSIDFRGGDDYRQLPSLALDLIARNPAVIFAAGNVAAHAAKAATITVPIVFHTGDDPIATGLVSGLNHLNGNVTGVSAMAGVLPTKRLELLHQIKPDAGRIGVIVNANNANMNGDIANLEIGAQSIGLQLYPWKVNSISDFENVFAEMKHRVDALLVNTAAFLTNQRVALVALSERYGLPTIYSNQEFTKVGGLISYGANRGDTYRIAGGYVGRILGGEKPSDLPVQQPTKFYLSINLKTAKALGLTVPVTLLASADEVIE
jgi:putative ABC transport system substrate-binding protein